MLRAAAMTYVASLLVTLANLLRFISLFTGGVGVDTCKKCCIQNTL